MAADLVWQRLLGSGALGALVNLGGDVRCLGEPRWQRWQISIDPAIAIEDELVVRLDGGAVCTSTRLPRRWHFPNCGIGHHLLDRRTGRSAESDFASVSVIAPEAWLAEVLSRAVFLMPTARAHDLLRAHEARALVVSRSGGVARI